MVKNFNFVNFWSDGNQKIIDFLSNVINFDLLSFNHPPQLIIKSIFGKYDYNRDIPNIFFSGENKHRVIKTYKYEYKDEKSNILCIVTNTHDEYPEIPKDKFLYVPLFMFSYPHLRYKKEISKKKKFCCFLIGYRGDYLGCELRERVFNELSKYKRVDSGGRSLNNIGYCAPVKIDEYLEWLNDYKFIISFENSFGNGYVTEKLFNGLCAGIVPIYWGDNQSAKKYFNSERFLCLEIGNNSEDEIKVGIDDVIKRIIELDTNDELYDNMNKKDPFLKSTKDEFDSIKIRINDIIEKI